MKQNLKDYIKIHKVFDKDLCKSIIESFDPAKEELHTFYKQGESYPVGKDPKRCFIKEGSDGDKVCTLVMLKYRTVIYDYITNLKFPWLINWNGYSFPKFLKYEKNTEMTEHCDHIHHLFADNGQARGIPFLSIITNLNNDYKGGEIVLCKEYEYKLEVGDTIVFPSNFLYPHTIKTIDHGTRYSMTSWVY